MILGFDPGKDKCGVAVMDDQLKLYDRQVVPSKKTVEILQSLCQKFSIQTLVMGNQTTSKMWEKKLRNALPDQITIVKIDERYSSLEARDRYWQLYPPQGLTRLIPQGMRTPPCPIDDIVAMILIERYLKA